MQIADVMCDQRIEEWTSALSAQFARAFVYLKHIGAIIDSEVTEEPEEAHTCAAVVESVCRELASAVAALSLLPDHHVHAALAAAVSEVCTTPRSHNSF